MYTLIHGLLSRQYQTEFHLGSHIHGLRGVRELGCATRRQLGYPPIPSAAQRALNTRAAAYGVRTFLGFDLL